MSDTIFREAVERTLSFEGEYTNNPSDPGGETKFGISKRAYPYLDIKELTMDQAISIYKKDYWDRLHLDEIEGKDIPIKLFDISVNMGVKSALKILQNALNYLGENLVVDGIIGSLTIKAANTWISRTSVDKALLKAINGFQFMRYTDIITLVPSSKVFSRGWMKRIDLCT